MGWIIFAVIVLAILWSVIGWRSMRALEKIAHSMRKPEEAGPVKKPNPRSPDPY